MVLTKAIAQPFGKAGYDGTYLVGRALSGVFDLADRLARLPASPAASPNGAPPCSRPALIAFCVLGIQLSHFWAVDTFLTTFSAAALLGAVRIAQGRSRRGSDALTGIAFGLAVACKITALALLLPDRARGPRAAAARGRTLRAGARPRRSARRPDPRAAAALVVRIFLPYVFLGPGALSFRLDPRWVDDLKRISQLSKSVAGFPPALQWAGRTLLFPVENFVLWGAGVFFGISAIAGARLGGRRDRAAPARSTSRRSSSTSSSSSRYHGLTLVKSIRYFYPAYPALAVLTRRPLLARSLDALAGSRASRRAVAVGVLGGTFLWALAFTSIYRHPQTRVAATDWIYTHVPARSASPTRSWDDGLPLPDARLRPGAATRGRRRCRSSTRTRRRRRSSSSAP